MKNPSFEIDRILKGDCLETLQTFPDNFFDSCVSDVPYGLGSKEPAPEEIRNYLRGELLNTGGDFMGKKWYIPSVKVWEQIYRVLKPGGHVLAFGGTRTFDLISLGLRMAGFENRDTIAEDFPTLQWVYGSGMPKSSNLAMNIDKKLGHEFDSKNYTPISDEAKAVAHLGSGLKPSWEPILVFRKPFKGSLMENVLAHGTGALNIQGARVKHSSKKDLEEHKKSVEQTKNKGGVRGNSWKNASDLSGANDVDEGGRWPANKVMIHHPDCELHGTKKVKGAGYTGKDPKAYEVNRNSYGKSTDRAPTTHVDENGTEDAPAWACAPGCPIAALDAQSGNRPSTLSGRADPTKSHAHPGKEFNDNSTFLGKRTHHSNVYADDGGASKYFKQFQQELEVPFYYSTKANRKKAGGGEFEVKHPTLKPYELMQYLVRLVTPKGGVVLDPYCGSGTTLHAAVLERCHYIGIDLGLEGEYEEAIKRMEVIHRQQAEILHQEELYAYAMGGPDDE